MAVLEICPEHDLEEAFFCVCASTDLLQNHKPVMLRFLSSFPFVKWLDNGNFFPNSIIVLNAGIMEMICKNIKVCKNRNF